MKNFVDFIDDYELLELESFGLPYTWFNKRRDSSSIFEKLDEVFCNRDKPQYPQFVVDTDMSNPQLSVGLLFTGAIDFRDVARKYAIKNGRNMFIKNEKDKVRVVCSVGCPWVVYAAQVRNEKTFQVRTYHAEHTCGRVSKNNNLTSRYLWKKYVDHFLNDPKLFIGVFMNTMRS